MAKLSPTVIIDYAYCVIIGACHPLSCTICRQNRYGNKMIMLTIAKW
jgi:hypothetical protein